MLLDDYVSEKVVDEILGRPQLETDIETYQYLVATVKSKKNLSEDVEGFQKKYNKFFVMMAHSSRYYQLYYKYMDDKNAKGEKPQFNEVLSYIFKETGRVETSFSSKMVAVFDPFQPIWDNIVANVCFGYEVPYRGKKPEEKLEIALELYPEYVKDFLKYKEGTNAKMIVRKFNECFPNKDITDVKKIDFVLWKLGSDKKEEQK